MKLNFRIFRFVVFAIGFLFFVWRFVESIFSSEFHFSEVLGSVVLNTWIFMPYFFYFFIFRKKVNNFSLIISSILLVTIDFYFHIIVLLVPSSSTSAFIFLISPILLSLVVIFGFMLGKILNRFLK